jgi:hypothetical protein
MARYRKEHSVKRTFKLTRKTRQPRREERHGTLGRIVRVARSWNLKVADPVHRLLQPPPVGVGCRKHSLPNPDGLNRNLRQVRFGAEKCQNIRLQSLRARLIS